MSTPHRNVLRARLDHTRTLSPRHRACRVPCTNLSIGRVPPNVLPTTTLQTAPPKSVFSRQGSVPHNFFYVYTHAQLCSYKSRRVHDTNSILAKHMRVHAHPHRHLIGTTPVAECGGDGSRSPGDRTGAASRHGTQRHQGAKFVNDAFRYSFRFGPQCATSHGMYVDV